MGKLIKGRFPPKKKAPRAKIKAKPTKADARSTAKVKALAVMYGKGKPDRRKVREYVTITHATVKNEYPCSSMLKRFYKTFPYSEFGARGVPITPENVLRGLKACLPLHWVLDRFANSEGRERYFNGTTSLALRDQKGRARLAAEVLAKYARSDCTQRFYVRGKVQSLKGVKLEPAPSPLGYSQQSLVA